MTISKLLIVKIVLLVLLTGRGGPTGPTDDEATAAIEKSLMIKVPSELASSFAPNSGASKVKEVKIIEIGEAQGEGTEQYWSVKVYAKGRFTAGKGLLKSTGSFDGETVCNMRQDGFGEWKASPASDY